LPPQHLEVALAANGLKFTKFTENSAFGVNLSGSPLFPHLEIWSAAIRRAKQAKSK